MTVTWRQKVERFQLTLGYILIALTASFALLLSYSNQNRIEHNAAVAVNENCEALNEAKRTIIRILDSIADDHERTGTQRGPFLRELIDSIELKKCPPKPL